MRRCASSASRIGGWSSRRSSRRRRWSTAAGLIAITTGGRQLAEHARGRGWLTIGWEADSSLVALAAIVSLVVPSLVVWVRRPSSADLVTTGRRHAAAFSRAVLLHGLFFVTSGIVLWLLAAAGLGLAAPCVLPLLGVATSAWILGFVVPGAPAGIGVREASMIVLLDPGMGEAGSALLAALFRLVTVGGDALFAVGGLL